MSLSESFCYTGLLLKKRAKKKNNNQSSGGKLMQNIINRIEEVQLNQIHLN